MDLRTQLATRFHIENIRELLHYIKEDERLREEIYRLIFDEDDIVSYQALWVCTHFSKPEVEWLTLKQDELIDAALTCPHSGKRRMLLNLLCQQQLADPPRVDLLDFCMERMVSRQEPAGVQSLCIKLAYQLTCSIPELQQELRTMLEIMEPSDLVVRCEFEREGIVVPEDGRFMGRGLDFCLDIFDYTEYPKEEIMEKCRIEPLSLIHI